MRWQAAVLVLLLGLTASSVGTRAEAWRKHVFRPDGFEVEFSGEPTLRPSQISAEAKARIVRSTNYIQDGSGFKYLVAATLTRKGVNFDKGAEAGFASYRCQTLLGKRELSLPGVKGREMSGTDCADGLQVHARYFMSGNWFYQVIARYKGNGEHAARRFVESFKVVGQ